MLYSSLNFIYFFISLETPVEQGLLIIEATRSHSDTPQSVGLLRRSDQPTQRSLSDKTQHLQETDIRAPGGIRTCSRC
jgi:hypothetical protein